MSSANCEAELTGAFVGAVDKLVEVVSKAHSEISDPKQWPTDYAEKVLNGELESYDFVVIGAGSAGSVVASRLSEDSNKKVLLLEAGGDPPQESEIPALFLDVQHTKYNWNYFTQPTGRTNKAMINDVCYWPRGKFLGGTGGINALLHMLGNPRDYDRWAELGNPGWSWQDIYKYFEKTTTPINNKTQKFGYLTVNEFPALNEHMRSILFKGGAELGIPTVDEFNEDNLCGYSRLPGTIGHGKRESSGKGYLARVAPRPNLHIIKHAHVTKINFDKSGKRAESVSFVIHDTHEFEVKILKEVIVSGGAINSPQLLMLSGIGPKEHLISLDIPVLHDLSIGNNLQDHLLGVGFIKINENQTPAISQQEQLDAIYKYLTQHSGPLITDNLGSWTAFINVEPDSKSPYPNLEIHYLYFRRGTDLSRFTKGLAFKPEYAEQIHNLTKTADVFITFISLAHPKSKGKIRLATKDYKAPPIIDANYLSEASDEQTVLGGFQHLMDLVNTKAMRSQNAEIVHFAIEECDKFPFKSEEYWRCYLKYFSSTLYHHVGTVKMGPKTDPTACVDSELRLHGIKNVRVVDASIMPLVTSGNTNAPIIMIAEKASDLIKRQWNGI